MMSRVNDLPGPDLCSSGNEFTEQGVIVPPEFLAKANFHETAHQGLRGGYMPEH